MAKKQLIYLLTIAACSYSALPAAQPVDNFDFKRFYAAPGKTIGTEFVIENEGAFIEISTGNRARREVIQNSSFSTEFDERHSPASARPAAGNGPELDHLETGASITWPICGASPASEDEIRSLVQESANRYGIDPDFALAVAWTESRFDRVRNSPKGARGPMQLMPDTAARFHVADVCNPAENIEGGMRYLHALLSEFKSPIIAAAAYNAGEQAVYDSGGIPAYPETVRYVASVMNRQIGLSFPVKRTGIDVDPDNTQTANRQHGVMGARAPAFVGGVMQF